MQYGESSVGTEATPTMEHETYLRVLDRDEDACLSCGDDEDLKVVKRHPGWRIVPENLITICPQCEIMQGTGHAQATGFTLTSHYGIGDRPIQTRHRSESIPGDDGWRFLTHEATLADTRPKRIGF